MRYLLRNAIRDRSLEPLRRANPGKALIRPMVGGRPLPAGGVRYLNLSDFTEAVVKEIEYLISIGNVQLLAAGRLGSVVDLAEIRALRGIAPLVAEPTLAEALAGEETPVEVVETLGEAMDRIDAARHADLEAMTAAPETPPSTESVVSEADAIHSANQALAEEHMAPIDVVAPDQADCLTPEETQALEEAIAADPVVPDEVQAPVADAVPARLGAEELLNLKLTQLRQMLTDLGGRISGKNKDDLVSEILELQGA